MRVYLEAYGCSQNQGEGRALLRRLHDAGHAIAAEPDGADVGVLVSCAVIGTTEAHMVERWRDLAERLPHVVVTGCMVPLRTHTLDGAGRDRTTFVPIRDQIQLPSILARLGADPSPLAPDAAPPAGSDGVSVAEEVVVAQGCTSHCTYCYSRLARGPLASVPLAEVLAHVAAARDRGAVEVRLSSLDTSCWGADLPGAERLPDLLERVAELPGDFQVRVGMMSPQSALPLGERLFRALARPRFFTFLHLPVQSGSDTVLHGMRRGYSVDEFRALVAAGRAACPTLMLATDVIVGFPGETEDDHRATLALLDEVGPEVVNVTRFSARPGTPAARLDPPPSRVAKRRSRELTDARQRVARARFERWIGWEGTARVVEHGPEGSSVARLPNYLPVVLDERVSLGARAPVRVEGARSTYLLGRRTGPAEALAPALAS